jgi:subtilisin family serine protease
MTWPRLLGFSNESDQQGSMPANSRSSLALVGLEPLMERTAGDPQVRIGLLDGPVFVGHPALMRNRILSIPGVTTCDINDSSISCAHGTFVLGILSAARSSQAPAICPGCTIIVRPIFTDVNSGGLPSTQPSEVAAGIIDCVDMGACVLNLSAAFWAPAIGQEHQLQQSLDYAARRGVLVVTAAGNRGVIASSPLTRHPWVIPAVAYALSGNPLSSANIGPSIGRRGLGAPGEGVLSLTVQGGVRPVTGSSVAAAFITGAIALLWSEFPEAGAGEIRSALIGSGARPRTSVVPPLYNAWRAFSALSSVYVR